MFKGDADKSQRIPQDLAADLRALQQAGHLTDAEAAEVLQGIQQVQSALDDRKTDQTDP